MQTNGVIERFSVQSVLMLSHLHTPDVRGKRDKYRKKPDSAGFNSMLDNLLAVKAAEN